MSQSVSTPPRTLGIAGVGLIGGSLAAAARTRGLCDRIVGFGRTVARLHAAADAGLLDDFDTTPERLAPSLDLLICCLPVDRIAQSIRSTAAHMRAGSVCSDAGSVKGSLCDAIGSEPAPGVQFIGGHPLAGSEQSGFEHADADLFTGRVCVLTPTDQTPADQTPADALEVLRQFWTGLGSEVVTLSPAAHDAILARTSHLPHLIAAAVAAGLGVGHERFAAGGFRDVTRIAAGDPDLWTAILHANTTAVTDALDDMLLRLTALRNALALGDTITLRESLAEAQARRAAFMQEFQREN